ncbi:MAG: hypothetical protein A2Y21_06040 [Clostridiales bacterium GWC2_40_7]|nr:MAG: hypothetical protein A2Y21_06040 [Clostridiales bacterium GWC2_40_7]
MLDQRCEKLAELIVVYSLDVKPGQRVLISANTEAKPLVLALQKQILLAKASPFFVMQFPEMEEQKYRYASDEVLGTMQPIEEFAMNQADAFILIQSDRNASSNSGVPAERMGLGLKSMMSVRNIMVKRAYEGKLKWTAVFFPTSGYAQQAGMSTLDFEDMVFEACMPDPTDPIGYWKGLEARQDRMIESLMGADKVQILAEETDLTFSIKGRKFINACCKNNVPDGEIYTAPIEDSVSGRIFFPDAVSYRGTEVKGVRLWFENGQVIKATAEKNEEFLLKMLEIDPVARSIGEFAFGTNDGIHRMIGQILLDEKIGGTVHIALGNGYPATGSKNRSLLHWDFILDVRRGGKVLVDGRVVLENGKYTI